MLRRRRSFVVISLLVFAILALYSPRQSESSSILRRLTNTAEQSLSLNPSLSDDGVVVAFESTTDLAGSGGSNTFHALLANLSTENMTFQEIGRTRAVSPALSGDGSKLAFASSEDLVGQNSDRNSEIYFFDGNALRQVTHTSPESEARRLSDGSFQPSISNDGQFIAFASNRNLVGLNADLNLEIFLFETVGQNLTQLTSSSNSFGATNPKISGDSSRIAFVSSDTEINNRRDMKLYDRRSAGTQMLVADAPGLSLTEGRAISDDGLRIVYSSDIATNQSQVFLFDARANTSRQITSLGTRAADVNLQATISGDGKRIAFATRRKVLSASDGGVELYLFDLPTAQNTQITDAPASATAEVVSSLNHDGSRIAFSFPRVISSPAVSSDFANNCEIYLASLPSRPSFGTATVLNAAAKGNEPALTKTVAPGSIATIKGNSLAAKSEQAQLTVEGLPLSIAGTTVSFNEFSAPMLYASPGEVTVVVPLNLSSGPVEVTVTNSDGFQSKAPANILSVAPGIFALSGDGRGEGVILNADTLTSGPFDPTGGGLRLSIFATGVRNASNITANIAGRAVTVETILSSQSLPGLDEIHLAVPVELRGAGDVTLVVVADGIESNPVTVAIGGNSLRDIMINEFLADPPDGLAGDANRDGVRDSAADEFVELVNSTARDLDLSGYQLQTRSVTSATDVVRHRFAAGTILPAGTGLIVFGGGNPDPSNPIFGGSQLVRASTGSLSLINSGGVITLRDASGLPVSLVTYGTDAGLQADTNQSLTRSPDITGSFVPHKVALGSGGNAFSPGTRLDGSFFLPVPAISLIRVSPAVQTLVVGDNLQFIAQAFDQNNQELSDVIFSWRTSATSIATVDAKGTVKAIGPGTAQIIALARTVQSAPSLVTVTQPGPTPTPAPSPSPSPSVTPVPSPSPTATPTPGPLPVVISEFRTRGPGGAGDEFIELYNNSTTPIDISGWKIKGSSSAGGVSVRLTVTSGTVLPARGHFLAGNSGGYSGSVALDQTYTSGLVNDGGLALALPNDVIVDQVGLSSGSAFREGMHLAPLPSDANQSYERKPGGLNGSTQDTNDNFADFQLLTPSEPQNLASDPRPGPSPFPSPSPTVSPTPTPMPSPTPSPTPVENRLAVISEFRTRGPNGASDEFIEIYNNSDSVLEVGGWKLRGSSSGGTTTTRLTISAGTRIPGHGHFLAVNSGGYSGSVSGDQAYTSGIANDGGLALTLPDDSIVDQVGLSAGSTYKEGMHLASLPSDANQSYERRPGGVNGSGQDSNDNFSDFQLLTPSDPQNMSSSPTPGPSPLPSPSPSPSPTVTPTPIPSPSPLPSPSPSPTTRVVISQIFGGGGNANAPFRNDFIELFNSGQSTINLAGWSVQYASATATSWSVTSLTPVLLAPGQYYLVQEASGGSSGAALPTPDVTGVIAMGASAGKVALVRTTTALAGVCPSDATIEDEVGFGSTANCFRGAGPTPAPGNATAVLRGSNGCTDTQNNSSDFTALAPNPRNSLSAPAPCSDTLAFAEIVEYLKLYREPLSLCSDWRVSNWECTHLRDKKRNP
jgi:uncharacterized protein (TIGR03437 family)